MSDKAIIYALSDPRHPTLIRYIGKTEYSLQRRLAGHISESRMARSDRACWIRSLVNAGVRPTIWALETTALEDWEDRERFWISFFWSLPGFLNRTVGGDSGFKGGKHSEETKARYREMRKGHKPSVLSIKLLIERNKRGLSREARRKISKTLTGRPTGRKPSPEFIAATIARNKRGLSPESIAKTASKLRGRKWTPEQMHKLKSSPGFADRRTALILRNKKGWTDATREKQKMIKTGKPMTPVQRAAWEARKPELVARLIKRNKEGLSPESRAKMAATLRGRKLSADHVRNVQSSEGWKRAQIAFAKANEERKKSILCFDTGQIFSCVKEASEHAGVSKQHMTNNIKSGWRTRGYHYQKMECAS